MSFDKQRIAMVEDLKHRGIIKSEAVYNAMFNVPRHIFLSEETWHRAYIDSPQPIDKGQTISAPHMNAMMCEYLEIEPGNKILEIGTGSGYQAALLSYLVGDSGTIYTIERFEELNRNAKKIFQQLLLSNIVSLIGDGSLGLKDYAPYDRILVTAAAPDISNILMEQLSPKNGIMCIPVGERQSDQDLYLVKRHQETFTKTKICKVIFVPLIGEKGFSNNL